MLVMGVYVSSYITKFSPSLRKKKIMRSIQRHFISKHISDCEIHSIVDMFEVSFEPYWQSRNTLKGCTNDSYIKGIFASKMQLVLFKIFQL